MLLGECYDPTLAELAGRVRERCAADTSLAVVDRGLRQSGITREQSKDTPDQRTGHLARPGLESGVRRVAEDGRGRLVFAD